MNNQVTNPSILKLIDILSSVSGFNKSDQLVRKLEYILKGLSGDALAQWVDSLLLDPNKTELMALIEDLTNHETYFFRDNAQMQMLEKKMFPELVQNKINSGDRSIKIWSAASSSGEEAYTLAILLLQTFVDFKLSIELRDGYVLPPSGWKVEILGTDVSRQVVRKAKEGIFEASDNGLSSFRNFPEKYLRFFELNKEYQDTLGNKNRVYKVNDMVKSIVSFDIFNLIERHPPSVDCDLILCRNLMIYLHSNAQRKVQGMLKDTLKPGGKLLLSAVDKMHENHGVTAQREMNCVYYEKN